MEPSPSAKTRVYAYEAFALVSAAGLLLADVLVGLAASPRRAGAGLIGQASWAERLTLCAPRISTRGDIDPPLILGLGSGTMSMEGITAAEARAAAEALLVLAAKCDRANDVITPHLRAAVDAADSL